MPDLTALTIERPILRLAPALGARREERSVAPGERHCRPIADRRELIVDPLRRRRGLGEEQRALGRDARRILEAERPVGSVHEVTGHVTHRTGAEVPPATPVERRIRGVIRSLGCGAKPEIPVERLGYVVRGARTVDRLRPDRPVGPVLHAPHRPDQPSLDPLADLADALGRMPLIAHLRRLPRALGGLALERTHLADRARERLLAVDVLAHLERHHRGRGMHVIGCRYGDRVDVVALLLEHLAVVLVALGSRPGAKGTLGALPVDVGEGDELFARHAAYVIESHSAHADAGDAQLLCRLLAVGECMQRPRHGGDGTNGREATDEAATIEILA